MMHRDDLLYENPSYNISSSSRSSVVNGKYTLTRIITLCVSLGMFIMFLTSVAFSEKAAPAITSSNAAFHWDPNQSCHSNDFSKKTLKMAHEVAFQALFPDLRGQNKFEASGVTLVDDRLYVVFDNLYSIGDVSDQMQVRGHTNRLVGAPGVDSGFEAITYDNHQKVFYAVQEAVEQANGELHAVVEKVTDIGTTHNTPIDDYHISERCPTQFQFSASNKGFEGAKLIYRDNQQYLFGLCEGNHCQGGAQGKDKGNGRIVVMRHRQGSYDKDDKDASSCYWETVHILHLPQHVQFVDYSAFDLQPSSEDSLHLRFILTSQVSAALWYSELDISAQNPAEWRFQDGQIFDFPRDTECNQIYCNIEGIHFMDGDGQLFAAVSDKMKSGGRQDYRCLVKDQSMHYFILPYQ